MGSLYVLFVLMYIVCMRGVMFAVLCSVSKEFSSSSI